jgi:hypothetical protein
MRALCLRISLLLLLLTSRAQAALTDEIQVYTDDINKKGEFGLELHVNTTLNGIDKPGYPGELTNSHGLRMTPEFSYGLSEDFEAGLYVPTSYKDGDWRVAGFKLRMKWLPLQTQNGTGWFAGANLELSDTSQEFAAARYSAELRTMIGYRTDDWLLAVNPVFGSTLSHSQESVQPRNPDFSLGYKVARKVADGVDLGLEYYNEKGSWHEFDPGSEQAKMLFIAADVTRGPLPFNFGIGKGLNGNTDKWTVKMIFEIPI